MKNKNDMSLNLLNENALKADFKVAFLVVQKLISTNEVSPINSQPKNNIKVLPEITKKTILIINKFKKSISLGTEGSYLKYENVYNWTNIDIVSINSTYENANESIKKSKVIGCSWFIKNQLPKLILTTLFVDINKSKHKVTLNQNKNNVIMLRVKIP